MAVSESFIKSIVERVVNWDYIVNLAPSPADKLLKAPREFVKSTFLNILIMAVANAVFTTTSLIDSAINSVISPFTKVRADLTGAISDAGDALVSPIVSINEGVAAGIANTLGFGAFPALVTLYVLEVALVIRIGRAAIPALSDAAGSIPVVGSLIDSVVTFGYRLIGGSK